MAGKPEQIIVAHDGFVHHHLVLSFSVEICFCDPLLCVDLAHSFDVHFVKPSIPPHNVLFILDGLVGLDPILKTFIASHSAIEK